MKKVVLITGASSGIGKATASYLAKKNFIVYGTTRNVKSTVKEAFNIVEMDVCQDHSVKSQIDNIISKEGKIDVLINNAGLGIAGPLEETAMGEVERIFQTNVYGVLRVCQEILPHMRKEKTGMIINITSLAGMMGLPYRGIYCASKYAVEGLTEALSTEVKQFGIKVLSVAPGDFNTNISQNRYHAPSLPASPYKEPYERTLNIINEHVEKGQHPKLIAAQIHRIIGSNHPQLNYKAARPLQKLALIIKKLLPSRSFEKIIMNHYKL